MALHRDIYWIGRQWAVTGHGIQAVDQRLKGAFDFDRAQVWQDEIRDQLRGLAWFNETDFDKAVVAARARFPKSAEIAVVPAELEAPPGNASVPGKRLQLQTRGRLGRLLPQWRIRR